MVIEITRFVYLRGTTAATLFATSQKDRLGGTGFQRFPG
jgi:hypothetical protein